MKNKLSFILLAFFSMAFILASTVEAKRFGGGYSFGGKKSYSSPFKQKSTQNKSFTQQKSASQQKAAASNQQRKQQFASRGGLMGMLGGLALGGLLGALFFGGAFEGLNFFDFLIIGGVILAFIWYLKRKSPNPQTQTATAGAYDLNMESSPDMHPDTKTATTQQFKLNVDKQDADFNERFDSISDSAQKQSSANSHNNSPNKEASFAESFGMNYGQSEEQISNATPANEIILPDWFDQKEFLSGARSAYTLLQEAWDKDDLETIRGLTSESVYQEIAQQSAQNVSQGPTRINQLNAELVDFQQLDHQTEAAVIFDALVSETDDQGHQGRTSQVRELWHFIRAQNSTESTWYLDGIQQME